MLPYQVISFVVNMFGLIWCEQVWFGLKENYVLIRFWTKPSLGGQINPPSHRPLCQHLAFINIQTYY